MKGSSIFSQESNAKYIEELTKIFKEQNIKVEEMDNFDDILSQGINKSLPSIGKDYLNSLKENKNKMLSEWHENINEFEKKLYDKWKKPLDMLEMLIMLSSEAGSIFNDEYRSEAVKNKNYIFDALTRLHSKACLTSGEILILLKSGYPAGAHARWRTLHEISVTCFFIKKHGNIIAERYLLHDVIESYKAMILYQKHCKALKNKPYSDEEISEIKRIKEDLCVRFGRNFGNNYGWASDVLKKENPNFNDIEQHINLDHLRPYYKMASHAIHSNPKGIYFNLGISEINKDKILLAGPSDSGLIDPGHCTAISLHQINCAVLSLYPSFNSLIVLSGFQELEREIGEAFLEAKRL